MKTLPRFRSWLRTVLHRSRMEQDMEQELRFHIERYTEDLGRGGIEPAEARRRARLEFGGVEALSLALGIGATTAIFSLVNSLLLRTLPVVDPQRLVAISSRADAHFEWTYGTWEQIRRRAQPFDGAFAWAPSRFNLAQGGETDPVDGLFASGEFFTTPARRLGRSVHDCRRDPTRVPGR